MGGGGGVAGIETVMWMQRKSSKLTENAILARNLSGMVSPLALSFLHRLSSEVSITSMQIITSPCRDKNTVPSCVDFYIEDIGPMCWTHRGGALIHIVDNGLF